MAETLPLVMMMNQYRSKAELLRDWLGLLRSGQYGQTQDVLKNDEGYCCLGVAADGLFNVDWELNESGWYEYQTPDGKEYASDNELVDSHAKALGLDREVNVDESNVYFGIIDYIAQDNEDADSDAIKKDLGSGVSRETWLIYLNDGGFTFDNIAQFVQLAGWITEAEQEETLDELAAFTQEMEA